MRNLNLKSIKGSLSREEMRTINGGNLMSEDCKSECKSSACPTGQKCVKFDCNDENGVNKPQFLCFSNEVVVA
jgi:hypothetical protein